jgi:hypothetical protein
LPVAEGHASIAGMTLRLLAVDMPPLIRELIARALLRDAHEGVFVDLPASGGDIGALARAARANAVVGAPLAGAWPSYCADLARGVGPPLFGLDCDDGRGRISELRRVETRCEDLGVDGLTIDELIAKAACAGGVAA